MELKLYTMKYLCKINLIQMKTSDPMGLEVQNLNCSSENVKKKTTQKSIFLRNSYGNAIINGKNHHCDIYKHMGYLL